MPIYGLSKFQVNNYDSWVTIENTIINVSESKVKDEREKAAGDHGNEIEILAIMRENCDDSHMTN